MNNVITYCDECSVLDDLGIRASDILQSNGIIWVEGPSDRIYLKHWIDLYSERGFLEGTHYQCVFYGGKLLAHLNAKKGTSQEDGVDILKANRNLAILIDSDRRKATSRINDTKKG